MTGEKQSHRTCTKCGTSDLTEACPSCSADWERRRDVTTMTPEERVDELNSWGGALEIDFQKIHQRIGELVGRPVFTHEMATRNWDYLIHEILTGDKPSLEGVIAKFPFDVRVIPVVLDDGLHHE